VVSSYKDINARLAESWPNIDKKKEGPARRRASGKAVEKKREHFSGKPPGSRALTSPPDAFHWR
jgi:hypothetical protein